MEAREAELGRRIEILEGRERELLHTDRALSERERSVSVRVSKV